ncbi:MAG: MGMT family protein [Clostridia bacterium]|nr:MGMT family protein [Clostridia bacterium]
MKEFTRKAIWIMQQIPEGKVMTYGSVARYAGSPRGARQISWILSSMTEKYHIPWQRIINSKGEIAIQDEQGKWMQKTMLEEEGVVVIGFRIDLDVFLWDTTQVAYDINNNVQ